MEFIFIIASLAFAAICGDVLKNQRVAEYTALAANVANLAAVGVIAHKVAEFGVYAPFNFIAVDALGAIVMLIAALVGCMAAMYALPYLRKEVAKGYIGTKRVKQYSVLSSLLMIALYLTVSATHPVAAWIYLEATTLSTVFLVSFYNRASTVEAAWKYIIINAVGLLLAFLGTLLYFTAFTGGAAGQVNWDTLLAGAKQLDPAVVRMAFVLVLFGYGTKVGLAPMHTWKPDVYGKSPAPLGALFSAALLPVAFVILLKFKIITDAAIGPAFSQKLFIAFGAFSVMVAAFSIFATSKYKRVLAYSSVEHAGIMALGFGFGGVGAIAATLHMVYHSLIKSALFFLSGNVFLKFNSRKIDDVKGIIRILPVTGSLLFAGLLAVTGLPPFGMFLTEILTLSAGISRYPFVVAIVAVGLGIAFIGFFRHVSGMALSEPSKDIKPGEGNRWLLVPPVIMLATALILTFYMPSFLSTLLNRAVAGF